jgi:hypothetical protein
VSHNKWPTDHDAQFLTANIIAPETNKVHLKQRTREIDSEIIQFQLHLGSESWEFVCIDNDTNNKFNSFLHTVLNIFEANFPVKYKGICRNKNGSITQGIKISCEHKSRLYIHSRDSNDAVIKAFYIRYCKILNKVIQRAKRQHYNRLIAKSDNKIKTTWNIIKQETEKIHVTEQMPSLLINDEKLKEPEKVADVFNGFFLSVAENLNLHQLGKEDPTSFLKYPFPCKFHGIKIVRTSEVEVKSIILSLK